MKKNVRDMTLSDRQLEKELQRTMEKKQHLTAFRKLVASLLVIAALLVLISALWFPIYQVTDQGAEHGRLVVAFRTKELKTGDLVVLYQDNQILMKRVAGMPGDWIAVDARKDMPELMDDQVPEGSCFVEEAGCVNMGKIAGKVIFCIWPPQHAGVIE